MISVWVMKRPRLSLSKIDFLGSPMFAPARLPGGNRALHHLLVDRQRAAGGGLELESADDAAIRFAQRARAEALLPRRVPRDGDQRAARDLQIDIETPEVFARSPEDRGVRLDEDPREVSLGEVIEHHDRLETRDELRRHPVA